MYKIIGIDKKEYGPVEPGLLRQWIAQGRVNAQSLARAEGETEWKPLQTLPEFAALVRPPPVQQPEGPGEAVATIIPYRNVPALAAYYLGVFSLIPFIGLFLGAAAFILGIMGLRRARAYPEAKGRVHAWIGIIVGGFFALLYLALCILIIVSIATQR
jgi:hypothetical protein